jgi:adenylosuccinate lyase
MVVHADRMRENLDITYGALFSQRLLLALVESGMTRDDAYRVAQEFAQRAWDERVPLRELLAARSKLGLELDVIFDASLYTQHTSGSSGGSRQTDHGRSPTNGPTRDGRSRSARSSASRRPRRRP